MIGTRFKSQAISDSKTDPKNHWILIANCEGDSQCAACGALANFMCSACKGVHYCSTQCQVSFHHLRARTPPLLSKYL